MSDLDRALAWAREILSGNFDPNDGNSPPDEDDLCRALLAEHERANDEETINRGWMEATAIVADQLTEATQRAEANAADARRWRVWRTQRPHPWGETPEGEPGWMTPEQMDAAADALAERSEDARADQQEATHE